MRFGKWVIPVLMVCLQITSCSTTPSAVLDDQSCAPPCWRSISPGESNLTNTMNGVGEMDDIQKDSLQRGTLDPDSNTEYISWLFQGEIEKIATIILESQIVNSIVFTYSPPIQLKNFIEVLGEPSDVVIISIEGDPMTFLTAYFLYHQKGICLEHDIHLLPFPEKGVYTIRPSTKINYLYFVAPGKTKDQALNGCLRGMEIEVYEDSVNQWDGYGKYRVNRY